MASKMRWQITSALVCCDTSCDCRLGTCPPEVSAHLLRLVAGAASLPVAEAACRTLLGLLGDRAAGGALTQAAQGLPSGGGQSSCVPHRGVV